MTDRLLTDEEILALFNGILITTPLLGWGQLHLIRLAQDAKTLKAVGLILAEWGYEIDMDKGILLEIEDSA